MMTNSPAATYKPCWIDRFNEWVGRLPTPTWIFYAGLGLALIAVQMLFLWIDEGLEAEELLPIVVFNALAVPFLLWLIQLLDGQAATALDTMRPALTMTEREFEQYKFSISNMPFLGPLIAGLALTAMTILTPLVTDPPIRYAPLEQLPVFSVVFHIIDKGSAFLFGVMLYHTVRQLRLVNAISSDHTRIRLFHLKPLRAFSRLTASTALGLVVFIYVWMLINPELLADPLLFGYVVAFTALAVSVFVWPLWGVHRLMQAEKERALHEIDLRFEEAFSKSNQLTGDEDRAEMDRLNGAIVSLEIQHRIISAIPTWPWSSETARLVVTAIALPLILMIIQFFVLQALE